MNPIQLQLPDGTPVKMWACEKCRISCGDEEITARCCQCSECGEPIKRRSYCRPCFERRQDSRAIERLAKATEVETTTAMLYSDQVRGSRDGYYNDIDDVSEAIYWAIKDGEEIEQPLFVHTCIGHTKGLDLESALEQMCDDTFEEAEISSDAAIEKLQKAVDEFNAECSIHYFTPDYDRKIRVPPVKVEVAP